MVPTKGSVIILNANADNGSLSSAFLCITFSSSDGSTPLMGGISSGDGRYLTTASSSSWTPLFLKADPHKTGTISRLIVCFLIASIILSLSMLFPSRKSSIIDSSWSDKCSIKLSLASSASALISSGISVNSNLAPKDSPSHRANFISIKSTIPSNKSALK